MYRITDKMLSNFRHVGLIHLLFPNARIIPTCRESVDRCLSSFSTQFANLPFTFDLAELGGHWRAYARLMQHWRGVLWKCNTKSSCTISPRGVRRIVVHCGLK
jgi:hypothetical protein